MRKLCSIKHRAGLSEQPDIKLKSRKTVPRFPMKAESQNPRISSQLLNNNFFSETSGETWNAMFLSFEFGTILLPPKSSVVLGFNSYVSDDITLTYPYRALWTTPYYGTPINFGFDTIYGGFMVNKNIIATMKILTFNMSSNGELQFRSSGKRET